MLASAHILYLPYRSRSVWHGIGRCAAVFSRHSLPGRGILCILILKSKLYKPRAPDLLFVIDALYARVPVFDYGEVAGWKPFAACATVYTLNLPGV